MRAMAAGLIGSGLMAWGACGSDPASGAESPRVFSPEDSSSAQPAADRAQAVFEFDIPAMPLADALHRYASLTRRAALVRSETVAGRRSSAVKGRYTSDEGLAQLLAGSGLEAESIANGPADAFVLKPVQGLAWSMASALNRAGDYPARVQARLWDALCDSPATMPGAYRALLRFRIDGQGRVGAVQLLESTGDAVRDRAVRSAIGLVRMEMPPPSGMPQPLTMIVLPNDPGDPAGWRHCGAP